jgi:rubrerythrin
VTKKVAMEFKNVNEILDFAIKSEVNAQTFYLEWSKKLENKALKKVFLELAGEEGKHKVYFTSLKEGNLVNVEVGEKITDLKISDYMVEPEATTDMDYQDALTLAMQREKEAFKLYSGLADMVEDPEMKKTFIALAEEEAKHKLRLEIMYDEEILIEN